MKWRAWLRKASGGSVDCRLIMENDKHLTGVSEGIVISAVNNFWHFTYAL